MIKFEEIPNQLGINGKELAKSTAEWEFMDGMTKVILSNNAPLEGTEMFKDREARKSEQFKQHLKDLKIARQFMLEAKTTQEALNARFEWYRTQNANKRTEMNLR